MDATVSERLRGIGSLTAGLAALTAGGQIGGYLEPPVAAAVSFDLTSSFDLAGERIDRNSHADLDSQTKLAEILARVSPAVRNQLRESQSAINIEALDFQGGKLIDHLHEISFGRLAPGLEQQREQILSQVVADLVRPGLIQQGAIGTCNVMPINYDLAKNEPAEFTRIIAGLVSERGSVELISGTTLSRVEDSIVEDYTGRTLTERMLQSAVRELVNPLLLDYSNQAGGDVLVGTDEVLREGLPLWDTAHAMEYIYGKDFSCYSRPFYSPDQMLELLKRHEFRYAAVAFDWDGTNDGVNDEQSGHTVSYLGMRDGRLYFRNSHLTFSAPGEQLSFPSRRMEDPMEKTFSMTVEEFKGQVCDVAVTQSHFSPSSIGMFLSYWTPVKALFTGAYAILAGTMGYLMGSVYNDLSNLFKRKK